jgi:hypothetical protein
MKMTVKQLGDALVQEAEGFEKRQGTTTALWAGAYRDAAGICYRCSGSRIRARRALIMTARLIRGDPVSAVYVGAARKLGSRARF